MQAAQWQMNPFAVAQKTYTVSGILGYEAQLVNAVISTRGPLVDRINYDWFGSWDKVIGKFEVKRSEKGEYRVPGWRMADEGGIGIKAAPQALWSVQVSGKTAWTAPLILTA